MILSTSNHTKCLYTDIQRVVCTTVPSPPRYGQCPKRSKSTLLEPRIISRCKRYLQYRKSTLWYTHTLYSDIQSIHSTANLSRHCIQFTPARVHNTSSLYPLDISSKMQTAFLIASEYYVPLWSGI